MSTAYALPETPPIDSDALYEVVDGVMVEVPSMGARATDCAQKLFLALHQYGVSARKGRADMEMLFILNTERDLRRRPDVSFITTNKVKLHPIPETGDWAVTPNLAIEVISPNDRMTDVERKIREYLTHGAEQVWIVLPDEKLVKVYHSPTDLRILLGNTVLREEELLPGFELDLAKYFG